MLGEVELFDQDRCGSGSVLAFLEVKSGKVDYHEALFLGIQVGVICWGSAYPLVATNESRLHFPCFHKSFISSDVINGAFADVCVRAFDSSPYGRRRGSGENFRGNVRERE